MSDGAERTDAPDTTTLWPSTGPTTLEADGANDPGKPPPARLPRMSRGQYAWQIAERYSLIAVWALMIVVYGLAAPSTFLTVGTFDTIAGSQEPLVFISFALLVTFLVGEFDLSVASMLGLSATLLPVLYTLHHVALPLAIIISVLAGVVAGAVNGFLVIVVRVSPIVATLGTGTLWLGVALGISNLETVGGLPSSIANISNWPLFGLPISFYYGILLMLVIAYVIRYTPVGRHAIFVGANREVARLAGIRVNRIRFLTYVMSGTLCGVGGAILVCGLGGFDPSSSQSYLLPGFSAVFLGTAVVKPGTFNPVGTMIAIYFLNTGIVGLEVLGVSGWVSDVFYGAALVIAVSVSALVRRRQLGATD